MFTNTHTYYSFKYGTLSPKELVEEACHYGFKTLALTDINNTSACFEFVQACRDAGIHPVVGIEFRHQNRLAYIGLARNTAGFRELNEFLSQCLLDGAKFPPVAPPFSHAYIIYPFGSIKPGKLLDHEFIGIRHDEVNRLFSSSAKAFPGRLVLLHPVTFRNKQGYNLNRLLCAIDQNTLLSKLPEHLHARKDELMFPESHFTGIFRDHPYILQNTNHLLESCSFDMDLRALKNRKTFTGDRRDDRIFLTKLALDGLKSRYGNHRKKATDRLARELDIIDRLGFSAYFLITWDFVRYAQSRGFFHVGRGSGANSIVAYCMGITDVDPIELDLYFERFLNPYRASPPDFDIDFSWKDRDEVIDYIFKRYGMCHTAMIATYVTFQGRSVIRELGKVFGLPKSEIDVLVMRRHHPDTPDHISGLIFKYGELLHGLPSHLSVHAGGILIAEEPIHCYTATTVPPKGFPITQFDMIVAEDVGLHKYDVLSQRGLGHIKDAAAAVLKNRGVHLDLHKVHEFKKDPNLLRAIAEGRTMGCFYIESPAMRQLLKKLHCDSYEVLVAASSVIRPGVAKSGMMREYIFRHLNPGKYEYIHPRLGELMEETYGVMVYQEDVIKVAHHFAGLDLGEADVLRRVMSGKSRDGGKRMQELKEKFFANCGKSGYAETVTNEVWRQIESFGGYSFCKAHSASFAVESFQSLYLKTYYPVEFMLGVINNFGGFYATEFYLHEARMAGARIHAPCVNHSQYLSSLAGTDLWLGFIHLKSLQGDTGVEIPLQRESEGPFRNLQDLCRRVSMGLEQVLILIRIGALREFGKSKKQLLWEAHLHFGDQPADVQRTVLFEPPAVEYRLPDLPDDFLEDAWDQLEILGYPLIDPFDLTSEKFEEEVFAGDLSGLGGKLVTIAGYLVTTKRIMTSKGESMFFGDWLDRKGIMFDTTHFPDSARKHPFIGGGVYLLHGKVDNDFGVPSIEVDFMRRLPLRPDPRNEANKYLPPKDETRSKPAGFKYREIGL